MDLRINYLPSRPEGFLGGSEGRFDGFILRKTDAWNALRHPFEAGGGPKVFARLVVFIMELVHPSLFLPWLNHVLANQFCCSDYDAVPPLAPPSQTAIAVQSKHHSFATARPEHVKTCRGSLQTRWPLWKTSMGYRTILTLDLVKWRWWSSKVLPCKMTRIST